MLRKMISVLIVLALIVTVMCFSPVTFAATVPQSIKCTSTSVNVSATANSTGTNKSWIKCTNETLKDDLFTDVYRLTSIGTDAIPITNQFRFQFQNVPKISLDEYCYFSVYYRVNSSDGNIDYTTTPPGFLIAPFNKSSGTLKGGNSTNTFDVWKKISVVGKMTTDVASGSQMYVQITFPKPSNNLPPYCIDFAQPTLIYFGIPEGETDTEKDEYVQSFLNDSSFTSITLDGKPISLEQYPKEFSNTLILDDGTSFAAVGINAFGEKCDVTYSEPNTYPYEMKIVSYAKNYDFTSPDDDLKSEYKISITPAEAISYVNDEYYSDVYNLSDYKAGDSLEMITEYYNFNHSDKTYLEILKIFKGNKTEKTYVKKYSIDSKTKHVVDSFKIILPEMDYTDAYIVPYIIETGKLTNISMSY